MATTKSPGLVKGKHKKLWSIGAVYFYSKIHHIKPLEEMIGN